MRRRLSIAALVLAFASPAWSQTAIQPGTITGTWQGSNFSPASGFTTVYTAPGDRAARVTDIIFVNYHTALCLVAVATSTQTLYFNLAPGSFVVPLNTGMGVAAGGTVNIAATPCPSATLYVQVRGFNFTIP